MIDAWIRVSLVGIDLVSVEARVVVASIDTYLRYAEAVGLTGPISRGVAASAARPAVEAGEELGQTAPDMTDSPSRARPRRS